ncbi:mitochondrial outer membrane protein porin of 36 kDa-like [Cornus florida]|uniref:mitochondrial outer membrane protein porin of 36 kDa-like n=1 Tax=Cornus florida TaxID=4283 RepID=UPI0028998858|nr:mitochondrial outer membrane protein porin of 36 kDa-like [Cornus florida]
MSNGPGIYHGIGKKARDLLYKDYFQQPPIHFHYQILDWSFNLSCQINEIVPGLGTDFRFFIPYQRSNKVELRYLHDYVGVTAGISLATRPILDFSGVVGSSFFSIGTELAFDSATATLAKCNAGFTLNSPILIASLSLNDKADTLRASCYRSLNPLTSTAVAAELTHRFFSNETVLSLGTQYALLPITTVKARLTTNFKVGALIQQQLWSPLLLTIAGEVDFKAVTNKAKLGLSLAIRP